MTTTNVPEPSKPEAMEREPSLASLIKEYLNSRFTKTNLQKYCRDIGLKNVWVGKDVLIEMIKHTQLMKKSVINKEVLAKTDSCEEDDRVDLLSPSSNGESCVPRSTYNTIRFNYKEVTVTMVMMSSLLPATKTRIQGVSNGDKPGSDGQ